MHTIYELRCTIDESPVRQVSPVSLVTPTALLPDALRTRVNRKSEIVNLTLWILLGLLLLAACILPARGQSYQTPTWRLMGTNVVYPTNWIDVLMNPNATNGQVKVRLDHFISALFGFSILPPASVTNAIGRVYTNGTPVTLNAVGLDIVTGTNTVVIAAQTNGVVTLTIHATASGTGVEGAITNAVTTVQVNGTNLTTQANTINFIPGTNCVINATNVNGVVHVRVNTVNTNFGTVTHSMGPLTANLPVLGNGADDLFSTTIGTYLSVLSVPTIAQVAASIFASTNFPHINITNTLTVGGAQSNSADLATSGDFITSAGGRAVAISGSDRALVVTGGPLSIENEGVIVASLRSNLFHIKTNLTLEGSLKLPSIETNKLLFTGGDTNANGIGLGDSFAISGGNLSPRMRSNSLAIANSSGVLTNAERRIVLETNQAPLLSNIVAGAASGTVVELLAGKWHIGGQSIKLPVGVTLRGQGPGETILSGWSTLFTNGPMVVLSSTSILENIEFDFVGGHTNYMGAFGFYHLIGNPPATNARVRNVVIPNGETDAIWFTATNYFEVYLDNVHAKSTWDVFVQGSTLSDGTNFVEVRNSSLISDRRGAQHPNSKTANRSVGVNTSGGCTAFYNSRIVATNANDAYAVTVQGLNGRIVLNNCVVEAAGTNNAALADNVTYTGSPYDSPLIVNQTAITDSNVVAGSVLTYKDGQFNRLISSNAHFGDLRVPTIATNKLFFMGGQEKAEGLSIGANLSVVGGALVASSGSASTNLTVIGVGHGRFGSQVTTNTSTFNGAVFVNAGAQVTGGDLTVSGGSSVVISGVGGLGVAGTASLSILDVQNTTELRGVNTFAGTNYVTGPLIQEGRHVINTDRLTSGSVGIGDSAGPEYSLVTSNDVTLDFVGTPFPNQQFAVVVSNAGPVAITATFTNSYSTLNKGNTTTWSCMASNFTTLTFKYYTNFNTTGGFWMLKDVKEFLARYTVVGGILETNAGKDTVTHRNVTVGDTNVTVITAAGTNFVSTTEALNVWGRLGTNVWNSRQGGSVGGTNLANGAKVEVGTVNISTNAGIASGVVTNGMGRIPNVATSFGGANTNIVVPAGNDVTFVDAGTTNVNLVMIAHGTAGVTWSPTIIFTNYTTTSRQLSFGSVSNQYVNLQQYDGLALPYTISNKHTLVMATLVTGSNVIYALKQATNGF